ncbi:thermostable hemolysin [Streptomyces goshikiensis]|uniref:thermostable hemolysin n=1 Tax=Streptomyces goshikiensis TaxID=1942 RepID=UPI00365AC2BE
MLKISLALRDTSAWHEAGDLARTTYAAVHAAKIQPDPDSFIVAVRQEEGGEPVMVGCAGCTHVSDEPFFSERYLDTTVEKAIAERTGTPVDRANVIEIGALASVPGSGQELVRLIPIISWCMGMEYILCTVTAPLRQSLRRAGIGFTVLNDADPERLDPQERGSWGTYYDHLPQVGFIELRKLADLFANATGRYTFLEPMVELLTDTRATAPAQEAVSRASR